MAGEELPSVVEFSMDLGKQEAPEPLPVGNYLGIISAVTVKMSQRETKYAEVAFKISADQFPADYDDGNPDGMTLYYRRCSLEDTANARYGTRRFCEAIGAPLGKKIDTATWLHSEAELEITHEPYEGVMRANVNRVRAA